MQVTVTDSRGERVWRHIGRVGGLIVRTRLYRCSECGSTTEAMSAREAESRHTQHEYRRPGGAVDEDMMMQQHYEHLDDIARHRDEMAYLTPDRVTDRPLGQGMLRRR